MMIISIPRNHCASSYALISAAQAAVNRSTVTGPLNSDRHADLAWAAATIYLYHSCWPVLHDPALTNRWLSHLGSEM